MTMEVGCESFDELVRGVLTRVRELPAGTAKVEPSDDVLTRRYGYEVASGPTSTFTDATLPSVVTFRIGLHRLKSDPWAKHLADPEKRDRLTRALAAGELPDGP